MPSSDNEDDGAAANKKLKVGAQKFTMKTQAYQKLKKMFEDGTIQPVDKPSDIRNREASFQAFTHQQFRSQFTKLRNLHGTCTKEGKSMHVIATMYAQRSCLHVTNSIFTAYRELNKKDNDDSRDTARKAKVDAILADNDDDDAVNEDEDPLAWVPKKNICEWTNDDGIKCISIIFQLSGGSDLADSNDVEVQVSTLGDELAISEVWTPIMANTRNFFSTFPKLKSESDQNAMRRSIAMCDKSDVMAGDRSKRSTYKMSLPFRVDPSVKTIRFLGTEDGQRYAAVDLAERSMCEVETFCLFKAKAATDSDKKRKLKPSNSLF